MSNRKKQEVYSPKGDLSFLPAAVRGSPHHADGRLLVIKVLGSFLGDAAEASRRLVERVRRALAPLAGREGVCGLHDTRRCNLALQIQMTLNRFCANTSLNYFLRTMPEEATREAARLHDRLIGEAFDEFTAGRLSSAAQRRAALQQARLPVKLGGAGLTSMSAITDAAIVGSWCLCWEPIARLCPQLARGIGGERAAEQADAGPVPR